MYLYNRLILWYWEWKLKNYCDDFPNLSEPHSKQKSNICDIFPNYWHKYIFCKSKVSHFT